MDPDGDWCRGRRLAGSANARIPINLSPGVFVAPEMVTAAGSPLDPPISREAEHAEQVEQLFGSELRLHGVECEWDLLSPGEAAALIDLTNSFDLTILGQLSPETRSSAFGPDLVIVASGRPILLVPYAGTFDTVGRRALVAWDGTREAARRQRRVTAARTCRGGDRNVCRSTRGEPRAAPPFPRADCRSPPTAWDRRPTRGNPTSCSPVQPISRST